jgi:hypothetical protein
LDRDACIGSHVGGIDGFDQSPGRKKMKLPENIEDLRRDIKVQLADMSRLLESMNNDDETVREARTSFLRLSVLVGRALDIELQ